MATNPRNIALFVFLFLGSALVTLTVKSSNWHTLNGPGRHGAYNLNRVASPKVAYATFLAANAIVGSRIEPFFSLIRPGLHTSPREYVLLAVGLLLVLVGALVTARPMLHRRADGRRRIYAVNAILAAALASFFVMVAIAVGSDIYRCDVLGIPNCD